MTGEEWLDSLRPWLRDSHRSAFEAALEWLLPRCRTEEERVLTPVLLLMLSPFNALIAPCRPAVGSCVNFQVTMSRSAPDGPVRVRLTIRARPDMQQDSTGEGESDSPGCPVLVLDSHRVGTEPLNCAVRIVEALLSEQL